MINQRTKLVLQKLGFTQKDIAVKLGLHPNTVSGLVCGKTKNVPVPFLEFLVLHGVSLNWLFSGRGEIFMLTNLERDALSVIRKHPKLRTAFTELSDIYCEYKN